MKSVISSKRIVLVGIGLVAALALATGCSQLGAAPAAGSPAMANTITVSGSGEASGVPDTAYVMLGVSVVDSNVGQAVADANATMQQIMDAMKEMGIAEADMQTVGYSVWPEDKYDPQTGQPTGERIYHVDTNLQVKVRDMARTGEIIDAGLNAGANSVGGLSFGIEDTAELEAQARTSAIEDARARAQQLAEAIGVQLGEPIVVVEGVSSDYYPFYPVERAAMEGLGGGGGAPAISPGQQTVSLQVTVTFSTK